jgi:GNAT superfamily N-acetyltransferase
MGGLVVRRSTDPAGVLEAAEAFLVTRPVEHNILLTILHDRVASPWPGRYWWVVDGDRVVGLALQSPLDFRAGVSPLAGAPLASLVDALADDAPDLPGVVAEAGTAAAFAGRWAERRRAPVVPREGQRIYRVAALRPPDGVPGGLREATAADADALLAWFAAFHRETDVGPAPPPGFLHRRLADGRLWVWDDGGPVSTAMLSRPVAGVSRVGFVYTPPEHRGHGYAAACTAGVSAQARAEGADTCILYTQLQNPTSNAVYRRIGYVPVMEVLDYRFLPATRPGFESASGAHD